MSIQKDLKQSTDNASKTSTLKFRLFMAEMDDVDVDNYPKAVNATISTNPLLPGKTFKFLDVNPENVKPNAAPGESPITSKLTLTPIIEGISKATLAWVYENVGKRVLVVWERCADGQRFIGGSPCSNGLQIKLTSIGAQDGGMSGIALSLEGGECPEPFCFYDGEIPTEAPTAVTITEGAFALGTGAAYILPDNDADTELTGITGVTDGDIGRVIELRGAGITHPTTIAQSATFALANGVTYVASFGTSIFLQITKVASAYVFAEVHRA